MVHLGDEAQVEAHSVHSGIVLILALDSSWLALNVPQA
jgi:hypothetical protein